MDDEYSIDNLEGEMLGDKHSPRNSSNVTPGFLKVAINDEEKRFSENYKTGAVEPVEENNEKKKILFLKSYTIVIFITALALIGCSIPLLADIQNYDNVRAPLAEVGSEAAFNLALPYMLLISVFLLCIASYISYYGYRKQAIEYVYVAMLFSVVSGASCLWIGFTTLNTLDLLLEQLESNPISSDFGQLETDVVDFTSAIFNECCLPLYDNRNYTFGNTGQLIGVNGEDLDDTQREVPPCGDTLLETCPTDEENRMFPEIVTNIINRGGDFGNELLCFCHSNTDIYTKLIEIFRRDGLCNAYRNLVIEDGADVDIPIISQSFNDLFGLLADFQRQEFQDSLPIQKMAVVGKPLPPEQLFNEPSEPIGFSCGVGYAKGLSFQLYLYVSETTRSLLVGAIVLGSIALLSTLSLNSLWWLEYICQFDEGGDYDEYDDLPGKNVKRSLTNIGKISRAPRRLGRLFSKAKSKDDGSEY